MTGHRPSPSNLRSREPRREERKEEKKKKNLSRVATDAMSRSHRITNYIRAKLPKKIKKKNKIKQNRTKNSAVFVTFERKRKRVRVFDRNRIIYIYSYLPVSSDIRGSILGDSSTTEDGTTLFRFVGTK